MRSRKPGAKRSTWRSSRSVTSTVPAGTYYLRVEPEGPSPGVTPVNYSLKVRRDVPSPLFYLLAIVLLLVPPIFVSFRAASFEAKRWQESDYSE